MNSVKSNCALCNRLLTDPVTLECGYNVCCSHLNIVLGSSSYFCDLCHQLHFISKLKLHTNQDVLNSLVKKLQSDPLSLIDEASETLQKMDTADPEYFVYEYFEDLKRQVDLRREKLKTEIDEHSDKLIQTIAERQADYMESARVIKQKGLDKTVSAELNKAIDKYQVMPVKEEQFEGINRQVLELKFQCDKLLEQYQLTALRETYRFQFRDNVDIAKIFGSLNIRQAAIKIDSKIVPFFQRKLFQLCGFGKDEKLDLIYRASRDGFNASDFHLKCDGIKNTLVVIQSSNGYVFGGFTKKAWSSNDEWIEDPESIIFSLFNHEKTTFKGYVKRFVSAIGCFSSKGPRFGDDITIASSSNVNEESYSVYGHSYKDSSFRYGKDSVSCILAGSKFFRTQEIEVFF